MSTDLEWEKWGRQEPYFGVITAERFRANRLDEAALAEFFASGQQHMECVLHSCRSYFDAAFTPKRVMDFGCGVGRLLIPFAALADEVVGVDVSAAMLAEAAKNCEERSLANVQLALSDDELSRVDGTFDLVHSAITLQHIEVQRGRQIIKRLIERLAPHGVMALQITYAKADRPDTFGQPAPAEPAAPQPAVPIQPVVDTLTRLLSRGRRSDELEPTSSDRMSPADPEMQMNPYHLSEIAYLMQTAGIAGFHAEFTDHGGELGVFLYFRRPQVA